MNLHNKQEKIRNLQIVHTLLCIASQMLEDTTRNQKIWIGEDFIDQLHAKAGSVFGELSRTWDSLEPYQRREMTRKTKEMIAMHTSYIIINELKRELSCRSFGSYAESLYR